MKIIEPTHLGVLHAGDILEGRCINCNAKIQATQEDLITGDLYFTFYTRAWSATCPTTDCNSTVEMHLVDLDAPPEPEKTIKPEEYYELGELEKRKSFRQRFLDLSNFKIKKLWRH